jgi:hypothetical protein
MNPLILIGLIGGGLYLYSQSQSSTSKVTTDLNNPNPKYFYRIKSGKYPVTFQNGTLEKSKYYNEILNEASKKARPGTGNGMWIISSFFGDWMTNSSSGKQIDSVFNLIGHYPNGINSKEKDTENWHNGIKWLYDQNSKLMNEIFYDYIKYAIKNEKIEFSPATWKIILDKTFNHYFLILQEAGVPESKWPGQNIEI